MMKRFTFTILGLLLLLGGANSQTALELKGGNNVTLPSGDHPTSGTIRFQDHRAQYSYVTNGDWVDATAGTHTFEITLGSSGNEDCTLHIAALNEVVSGSTFDNGSIKAAAIIQEESITVTNNATLTLSVSSGYSAIILWQTSNTDYRNVNIASFTRTITTASSVAAPTISPASGTYDGDFRVTITPGEGNTSVKYSISGSTSHDVTNEVITEETVISFTDNQNITVTATGYNGVNASSEVSKTYTYGIPDGKETATANYYQIVPLTMSDETTPAYFDFEDGTTLITGTSNINSDKLSIVDCDAAHTTATGSTKCMKIDLSDKEGNGNFYDVQVQLVFNGVMSQGHTYYVHFWTKADSYTNNQTKVRFQRNGNDGKGWDESASNDIAFNTDWYPNSYTIQPSRGDASMMVFDLGKVANNTIYLDDVTVYDVTSGNTPVEFTSRLGSAVISASAFDNYAVGDYVSLNITGTPTEIAYKEHASNDETAISNYPSYTALTQSNGNWLIPVTAGMKTNGLTIKGHDMTLNSVDIYKKVAFSEAEDNTISSKEDNVVVELTRSFVAGTWNTVCLPFALTTDQATQLFGSGYQLAEFTSVSGTTMKFTTAASFEAGVPYLVKPTIDVSNASPVVLVDVNITAKTPQPVTHGDVTHGYYSFVGTFSTKTFSGDECNTSLFVAANNELMKPNNNSALKSLRCYFTVPSVAAARTFSLGFDEEGGTTSINTVNGSGVMVNGYYNLNGQRVAKPTKGLFIVNGKKVLVNDKR